MKGDLVQIDADILLGQEILPSVKKQANKVGLDDVIWLSDEDDAIYEILEEVGVNASWCHYTKFRDVHTGKIYEVELNAERFKVVRRAFFVAEEEEPVQTEVIEI